MYFPEFDLRYFLLTMVALVICITIHEFAHAYAAVRAGDDTPRRDGRISLNPIDHLEPLGTMMMVLTSLGGFGFGWGKPVRVNHLRFRNPRWDNLRVSAWGPGSNILTAAVLGFGIRFFGSHMSGPVFEFVLKVTSISLVLAFFNLIPVGPLDGAHVVSSLLPADQARRYDVFMMRYGFMILLAILILGLVPTIIGPPVRFLLRAFTGSLW